MQYFYENLLEKFKLPLDNSILVFSILLFIILLTPIVLRKIRIPSIIGLIIAGLIIGPHGLNIIGEKHLLPSGSMKMLRDIGLIYIMFIAGLELNLGELKIFRNKSIVFGILTFIIPISLGYPICIYVLNMEHTSSLITAMMFSTHTLVAYSIVSKYGVSKNSAVAVAVGGTIITDTAVLLLFSVISAQSKNQMQGNFLITMLVSLTIFSAIMFYVIPKLTRWFFSKLESEKTSHFIFVLAVLAFSSVLAEIAGVESIIGAFFAGLVLNRLIPKQSSLMNRVEFIGNSLFIPFFLIGVGMVVNIEAFFSSTTGVFFAVVLTIFAIASKWAAAFVTQKIFRYSGTERQLLFGLSTAHAAATLAIITKGREMLHFVDGASVPVIGDDVVNGTIVLILVTCMVASFVTENAGKKQLLAQANDIGPNMPQLRSQHLLVAANELKGNEFLLDFATLVTDKRVINPISVVSVLNNDNEAESKIRKHRKNLDEFITHFSADDLSVNVMATIDHNFSSGVARMSKELVADLVVLNDSKNGNMLMRLVGDERDHLLDVCDKTVLFCQFDRPSATYDRIVLMCPPLAELEPSFSSWADRVIRYAQQLSLPVILFSTEEFKQTFVQFGNNQRMAPKLEHILIDDLEGIFLFNTTLHEDDLIVFCSARKGSISYASGIETFTSKLNKAYENNDYIFIYPSQEMTDTLSMQYDGIATAPIAKGMEAVQKIRKELGNIFNLEKEEGDVNNEIPVPKKNTASAHDARNEEHLSEKSESTNDLISDESFENGSDEEQDDDVSKA
jgi:Kef-type K+ transport system membrane component KefB